MEANIVRKSTPMLRAVFSGVMCMILALTYALCCAPEVSAAEEIMVVSIRATKAPQLSYMEGDALDLSGMTITLTYSDGNKLAVDYGSFEAYGLVAGCDVRSAEHLSAADNGAAIFVSWENTLFVRVGTIIVKAATTASTETETTATTTGSTSTRRSTSGKTEATTATTAAVTTAQTVETTSATTAKPSAGTISDTDDAAQQDRSDCGMTTVSWMALSVGMLCVTIVILVLYRRRRR